MEAQEAAKGRKRVEKEEIERREGMAKGQVNGWK